MTNKYEQMTVKIGKDGFVCLEGEDLKRIVDKLVEKFADSLRGLLAKPGDTLTLTYSLRLHTDGHWEPVPIMERISGGECSTSH